MNASAIRVLGPSDDAHRIGALCHTKLACRARALPEARARQPLRQWFAYRHGRVNVPAQHDIAARLFRGDRERGGARRAVSRTALARRPSRAANAGGDRRRQHASRRDLRARPSRGSGRLGSGERLRSDGRAPARRPWPLAARSPRVRNRSGPATLAWPQRGGTIRRKRRARRSDRGVPERVRHRPARAALRAVADERRCGRAGARAVHLARTRRGHERRGTWFAVLCWNNNPRAVLGEQQFSAWKAQGARFITARPACQLEWTGHDDPDVTVIGDRGGQVKRWFDAQTDSVLFLRPDRCVAAACVAQRAPETGAALLDVLGSGPPGSGEGETDAAGALLRVTQPPA